jgi:hypothetical protein
MNFIDPTIKHYFSNGVYAKESIIPANSWLVQHAHKYDHLSILASGSVELIVDNKKTVIHAPACIEIAANQHHGVKSLTDVVWYCIHATNCTDKNEIDEILVAPVNNFQVKNIAQVMSEGA